MMEDFSYQLKYFFLAVCINLVMVLVGLLILPMFGVVIKQSWVIGSCIIVFIILSIIGVIKDMRNNK